MASNDNLDRVVRRYGIERFVNKNPSQLGYVPYNIMTATVEAVLGGVWLDGGMDAVKGVMCTLGLVPARVTIDDADGLGPSV